MSSRPGRHLHTDDQRFVNDLLNDWDFIGVAEELPDGQEEYDCLVDPLLQRLRAGEGPAELEAYLNARLGATTSGWTGPATEPPSSRTCSTHSGPLGDAESAGHRRH